MSTITAPAPQEATNSLGNNLVVQAEEQTNPPAVPEELAVPEGPEAAAEAINPFRWFILAGLITAAILQVLDTTIVNVALPQMAGNLGATSEEIAGW